MPPGLYLDPVLISEETSAHLKEGSEFIAVVETVCCTELVVKSRFASQKPI